MRIPSLPLLLLAALLQGCSHYYYVPNIQPVPLFKEKNELRFSGAYGGGMESNCLELHTAWSPTDKVGLMAGYMHAGGGDVEERDFGKGNYVEGAVGYYRPIEKYGVFEAYGGLGGGKQHHEYTRYRYNDNTGAYSDVYDGYADISLVKLYIQPSFGFTHSIVDAAFSSRLCFISFTDVDNHVSADNYEFDDISALTDKKYWYLEPAITLRAGWNNIKAQFQFCYSANLNSPRIFTGEEAHVSVGVYIILANRLKMNIPDL